MGYKTICRNGVQNREHRYIMQDIIGRKLGKNEIVHHIDGNKKNNNPDNLMIVTRSEHAKMHYSEIAQPKKKAVVRMDKGENYIDSWDSVRNAAFSLGLYPGNITKCCEGILHTTGGYKWKYAE